MKSAGGKTPTDSITVSPRKGIEESIENLSAQGIDPISRNNQGKVREHCLKRDGYRCVATRLWSGHHRHPDNVTTGSLQAAHIIPFSLGSFNRNSKDDVRRHSNIWVNINRYFPSLVRMGFNSEHLNDERNVMMIDKLLHDEFGAFRFCFVATGKKDNQYYMRTYKDTISSQLGHLPADRIMTFRSHEEKWDLPNPELLRIHAALCDFFHMSGHGERVDKILRDFEELGVFAHDGSTNVEELLASRLLSLDLNTRERSGSDFNAPAKHIEPAERGGQKPHLSGPENKPFRR